jgi:Cdc6-like AAA superfamily ATPase
MEKYKINSATDNRVFVVTESFLKLCNIFKTLKNSHGKIIHVVGAPGTGKSANIYAAIDKQELNVYDVKSPIKDVNINSKKVFNSVYNGFKKDFDVKSKKEVYKCLAEFDAVLFADMFHDSHLMDDDTVGFSVWAGHAGLGATKFYLLCMAEYLKERREYKHINIILQTAWRFHFRGNKYDLFSDMGILSKIVVTVMRIIFDVVVISYTPEETIKIVKNHVKADDKLIEHYIHEYGSKPRFICQALENEN